MKDCVWGFCQSFQRLLQLSCRQVAFLLAIFPFCLSTTSGIADEKMSDRARILSELLSLENRAGEQNPLKKMKDWHALYAKYAFSALNKGDMESISMFLFIGFVAKHSVMAATSQAFTVDLMKVYQRHPQAVLASLKKIPVLVGSTCGYLGAYFGFEGRNGDGKATFLITNKKSIIRALTQDDAAKCLAALRRE